MFLVELVMQGVRGIRELARLRFQSGFNFVAAGNEAGKTTAVDAALHLLFPNSRPASMDTLISKYAPDASRGALVLFSDDGAYYRVIEDFSKRAVNLSKYNAATKDFALMHKDWENTTQFMAGLTAGISEEEFARLFILRREHYAERQRPASSAMTASPRPAASRPAPAASAANAARLAELRETLRKAEEAADADYRLQTGKLKLEEIRKKLSGFEEINQRAADIESSLGELKGCEALPENLAEIIDEHEQRQSKKMADSDELHKEIDGLKMQIDAIPRPNLAKDPLFLAGALFGLVSVLAGVLALIPADYEMFFPLGVLFSFLLIAVAWYKGSRKNAERRVLVQEAEGLQNELAELEKSFEQGGASILVCMKATGSATTAELKDKAENYRYFLQLRDDICEQRKHLFGDRAPEDLQADYEKQQQEVAELETAARAVAKDAVDTYSIRQDIERLESNAGIGRGMDFGAGSQDLSADFDFSMPQPAAAGEGGFYAELAIASRIGDIEMETLVPAVEAAAQRNLSTITAGKYVRIEAGHEGEPVVHRKDDSVVNYADLSHGTKELIYFCLRTGLVEAIAGKRRLPLILDDALAGFDPGRQQAACQILRALGAKTQVILFTSNPALKAAGDVAAELK